MSRGDAVDAFLEALPASVEPATREIARRAAELRVRHGTRLRLPDALVVATAAVLEARRSCSQLPLQSHGHGVTDVRTASEKLGWRAALPFEGAIRARLLVLRRSERECQGGRWILQFIGCRIHRAMNRLGLAAWTEQRGKAMLLHGMPPVDVGGVVEPAIRAVGLVKTFDRVRAVDDISLDLAPGRIYGLLGPNGSGKTTLIRLLTGMTHATAGRAEVLGVAMPSRSNLSRIGYMTQNDGVYPALTVAENARFFGAVYGIVGDEPLTDVLRVVDLADRSQTITGTLSGGQRRRLSLACALIHRPPVLFLDEPTVGIDPLLRVQFWNHFRALADAGTTIVVSSHVMDEADRCDELLFVRSGRITARGTGREVRAQAGTDDLEQAFLRLGQAVEVTR